MDAAYLSGLAIFAGSVVGGLTSLTSAWLTKSHEASARRASENSVGRQKLYALPEIVYERCRPKSKRTGLPMEKGEFTKRQKAKESIPLLAVMGAVDQTGEAIFEDVPDFHRRIKAEFLAITIASGGCNVLNYLTVGPAQITAVDINAAHVALCRLKLAAAAHLPDRAAFYQFFGTADTTANIGAFKRHILPHLDAATASYWYGRHGLRRRRRIRRFTDNFYRAGLLGGFIGASHFVARLHASIRACS